MIDHLSQPLPKPPSPPVEADPNRADRKLQYIGDFLVGQTMDFAENHDAALRLGKL
jgi:hypothetical protein